jgi:hypothetical protein
MKFWGAPPGSSQLLRAPPLRADSSRLGPTLLESPRALPQITKRQRGARSRTSSAVLIATCARYFEAGVFRTRAAADGSDRKATAATHVLLLVCAVLTNGTLTVGLARVLQAEAREKHGTSSLDRGAAGRKSIFCHQAELGPCSRLWPTKQWTFVQG